MTERFAWIPGYEGRYRVTDLGRIENYGRGRFLSPVRHSDGYLTIRLAKGGVSHRFYIHRLVCAAFNGEPPCAGAQVAHIDGDPSNAAASNLRWTNQAENEADKARHGRTPRGEQHSQARLSEADVSEIKRRVASGETQTAVRADYGISSGHISEIVTGKKWAEGESRIKLQKQGPSNV